MLSYLHTRPTLITTERVPVKSPGKKKEKTETYSVREHERHFYVVPDLLAAPGAINFRIIVDDYYTIVPEGTNPTASEMRRAYTQYVIDPVVRRYSREIAARREQIKQVLDERVKPAPRFARCVPLSLPFPRGRADARLEERTRSTALQENIRRRLRREGQCDAYTYFSGGPGSPRRDCG